MLALTVTTPLVAVAQSRSDLHDAMRKLWTDHVTWTRLFIIGAAAGLPDKDATTQRLDAERRHHRTVSEQTQREVGGEVGLRYRFGTLASGGTGRAAAATSCLMLS
jgi:hypothetical protein